MKFIKTSKNAFILTSAISILSGCASALNPVGESSFSCPGMPQGVTCKTPGAVYKSTQGSIAESESDKPLLKNSAIGKSNAERQHSPNAAVNRINPPSKVGADVKVPLPVRASSQVMRIWIAPWIDKNEDLHVPSFLYTEVTPRRWNLGQTSFAGNGVNVPYRVIETAPGQSVSLPVAKPGSQSRERPVITPVLDDINLGDQLPLPKF